MTNSEIRDISVEKSERDALSPRFDALCLLRDKCLPEASAGAAVSLPDAEITGAAKEASASGKIMQNISKAAGVAESIAEGLSNPDLRQSLGKLVLQQAKYYEEGLCKGAILNPVNSYGQFLDHIYDPVLKRLTGKEPKPFEITFPDEKQRQASASGKIGELAGEVTDAALLAISTGGLSLSGRIAAGAALGGATGSDSQTKNFWKDRGEQAITGAAGSLFSKTGERLFGFLASRSPALIQSAAKYAGSNIFRLTGRVISDKLRDLVDD